MLAAGLCTAAQAQEKGFTHADTLRGTITPERAWWDVQRYDIWVKPDYATKTIEGRVKISYKTLSVPKGNTHNMQIDLQQPLIVDSVIFSGDSSSISNFPSQGKSTEVVWAIPVHFIKDNNVIFLDIPKTNCQWDLKYKKIDAITI